MKLTNKQLKKMVRKEKFELPEHYEDKIEETLKKLQPEMENAVEEYYGYRRRRRFAFVAAAMILVSGVCVGAGKLHKYMEVDLFGNSFLFNHSELENLDPVWDYMEENLNYGEFGKYSSITSISGPYFPYHEISSYDKFQRLVKGAGTDFLIPVEVPDGYHLDKMNIKFYLDSASKDIKLRKTEKKGSYIYQIFSLPAGFEKNVEAVAMTYRNDKGNYLYYRADLMNNGGLLFDEDARVEKIELDGFDGAASVFEKGETSITFTQNINPVKPREDIVELGRKEYFEYPKENHVAFAWKWKEMYEGDVEEDGEDVVDLDTFHYVHYMIKSDVLPLEELQKAAGSIKSLK